MDETGKKRKSSPTLMLAGCILVGVALGIFFSNITAGALFGLGVGLIVAAVMRWTIKRGD
jgi:membrane associated rhomboid family serine protease